MEANRLYFFRFLFLVIFFIGLSYENKSYAIASVGISKQAGTPRAIRQGVYDVDFTIIIENFSATEVAQNIQITHDISSGLPGGAIAVVQAAPLISFGNLTGGTNSVFSTSDNRLLDGTGNLGISQVDTIKYTLRLDMNGASSDFSYTALSTVTTTTSSPNDGTSGPFTFSDFSDNGTDPDGGDANDDPTDADDATVIASVDLAPVIVGVSLNANETNFISTGVFDIEYSMVKKILVRSKQPKIYR